MSRFRFLAAALLPITLAAVSPHAPQQGYGPPRPSPEHELLKKLVGTWEGTFRMGAFPGAPEMESKGVEVNRLMKGGLWVVTDYEDPDMMGSTFVGHGLTGYDPYEKKYVGVWIDNQTASLGLMEGDWDEETQTLTMTAEGRDPMTGEMSTATQLMVFESADERRQSMKGPGPGGEEMEYFAIEYVRKEK